MGFPDLVVILQASVQLLQTVQVKLLLQLGRLAQVLQHLLREAAREAAADLIDHGGLQPHVPLSQQPVAQVVPGERKRLVSCGSEPPVGVFRLASVWFCGCLGVVPVRPVEVFKGVGELQARQEEHRLQKLLQSLQSLHAAARRPAGLDHLVDVLGETLAHLHNATTAQVD